MGTSLRMLLATTCVAAIACCGYFVMRDMQEQPTKTEKMLADHAKTIKGFDAAYGIKP